MTIKEFGERMTAHDPCKEGAWAFGHCRTRLEVFDLLGSPLAADYFLKSMREGWGPSPEEFEKVFRPYVNGRHTILSSVGDRKLRSQVWCLSDEVSVPDEVRWLILVGCTGDVRVADWQVVKVFVDPASSVRMHCAPNSIVYVENYGGAVRVSEGSCKISDAI